jgi:hypothetical protein
MNNLQPAARTHSTGDPLELLRDRAARCRSGWIDLDATHVDVGGLGRIARLVVTKPSCGASVTDRSFAVVRTRGATYNDVAVAGGLRRSGRHYSLALLALVDALAAEPSRSPLAVPHPLDDLRAAAFFVASESVSSCPDHELVERSVEWVDRSLAHLRMPLRATGYLSARDALRADIDSMSRARAP